MSCPVCGTVGPGDPSVGIMEDDGVCPRCTAEGYEEAGCGCLFTPSMTIVPCDNHVELIHSAHSEGKES